MCLFHFLACFINIFIVVFKKVYILQVKEKVMDVIYKKVPFSQRPKAEELELGKNLFF